MWFLLDGVSGEAWLAQMASKFRVLPCEPVTLIVCDVAWEKSMLFVDTWREGLTMTVTGTVTESPPEAVMVILAVSEPMTVPRRLALKARAKPPVAPCMPAILVAGEPASAAPPAA